MHDCSCLHGHICLVVCVNIGALTFIYMTISCIHLCVCELFIFALDDPNMNVMSNMNHDIGGIYYALCLDIYDQTCWQYALLFFTSLCGQIPRCIPCSSRIWSWNKETQNYISRLSDFLDILNYLDGGKQLEKIQQRLIVFYVGIAIKATSL